MLVNGTTDRTFYTGEIEYNNNALPTRIHTPMGYISRDADDLWQYTYNLKDFQGSVRVTAKYDPDTKLAVTTQKTDFFVLGAPIRYDSENFNRYLYQDKEQQPYSEFFDFGWRQYDPLVGRWFNNDPADQFSSISPYAYVRNNPLMYGDPNGAFSIPWGHISDTFCTIGGFALTSRGYGTLSVLNAVAQNNDGPITPRKYSLNFVIDMRSAPQSYRGIKTNYNLKGWQVNFAWYWDEVLKKYGDYLDEGTKETIRKREVPTVTPEFLEHLKSKGMSTENYVLGESMDHHHINQGPNAVALSKSVHLEVGKTEHKKSGFVSTIANQVKKLRKSLSSIASRISGIAGTMGDISGSYLGDPNSIWSMFETNGYSKEGKVYLDNSSGLYIVATSIKDLENGRLVTYTAYKSYEWNESKKAYVGVGAVETKTVFLDKNGNVSPVN